MNVAELYNREKITALKLLLYGFITWPFFITTAINLVGLNKLYYVMKKNEQG